MLKTLAQHKTLVSVDLCCNLSNFCHDIIVFFHDRVHLLAFIFLRCDIKFMSRHSFFGLCFNRCRKRVKNCRVIKTLCRDINFSFTIELCLNFVATFSCWLRHSSFGLLEFCVATYKNLCRDTECCIFPLFASFLLVFFFFKKHLQNRKLVNIS